MMLSDIVSRTIPPEPWAEGDNIPWHDPAFSARMLREHLSQTHDAASRREQIIERQIAWIHGTLLGSRATNILDLGCGPGLYMSKLARLGHTCTGIDYSPASITYARERAAEEGLTCQYELHDLRTGAYGHGFGLAMLIFGELNVFPQETAAAILRELHASLADGGTLLLEPHTFAAIHEMGRQEPSWYSAEQGVFSDEPYLCLTEHFWHERIRATTTRHYVIEASGAVTRYAQTMQAYTEADYHELLAACGFEDIEVHPSLAGENGPIQKGLCAITARKM